MSQENKQHHCQTILTEIQDSIAKIIDDLHKNIQFRNDYLRNDIQAEIAKQIAVLQRFEEYIVKLQKQRVKSIAECSSLQSKVKYLKVACDALFQNHPKIIVAKNIRYETEYFLNKKQFGGGIKAFLKRATREFPKPTKVLIGLAMAIPVYALVIPTIFATATLLTVIPEYIQNNFFPEIEKNSIPSKTPKLLAWLDNSDLLVMVAISGAFGSIVSILIRLDQYKDNEDKNSAIPILVGFAKPLIGTSFGILVFAMINSNIISFPVLRVSTDPNKIENIDPKYYLFFTLAFLVGFSERLANDIVKRAEATLSPETEILKEVRETGQGLRETAHEVEEEVRETALEVRETAHEVEEEVRETALELRETPDRAEGEMKIIQPTTSDTSAGNSKTNPQH
jgi:hypothetical protein